ncbi:MAG: hypothetical protein U1E21_01265 [Reyranellaceae bacterium]
MVFNLKPVTVFGFTIERPVGRGGKNQPDDIFVVKTLLNGIAGKEGGADGSLDTSDLSSSPEAMEPLIEAIVVFQAEQAGLFHDGRVDPEKNTIKRMRALFKQSKGGSLDLITIAPDGPIVGPCDAHGFSAARLKTNGGADWTAFDASAPVRQMIPVGRTRKLRVGGPRGTLARFFLPGSVATIIDSTSTTVTVLGLREGEAALTVAVEGQSPAALRLLVRGPSSVPLDIVHLGAAPAAAALMASAQRSVLGAVNRIFVNQANLTFTPGTTRGAERIRTDGREVVIDPSRTILIRRFPVGPPRDTHEIRFGDLRTLVTDPKAVTMIVSAQLRAAEKASVVAQAELRNKLLWFNPANPGPRFNTFATPAHEIGHSLGLGHIVTPNSGLFLVHKSVAPNNFIIPCETLVQLAP